MAKVRTREGGREKREEARIAAGIGGKIKWVQLAWQQKQL